MFDKIVNWKTGLLLLVCALAYWAQVRSTAVAPPPDREIVAAPRPAARTRPPVARPDTVPAVRPPAPAPPVVADNRPPGRLRLMAANLTSGANQSYNAGHGIRIMQGVRPDVVMIQEFKFRGSAPADLQAMADSVMGGTAFYYREESAQIPNGIISRHPIRSSGEWDDPHVDNRDFAWACVDIPGPVDLWAVSVHLLTTKSTERNAEAQALVEYIGSKVPAGVFLAIGGDFNTGTKNEACYATLSRVVVTGGPYPADQRGNSNTNANRTKFYDTVLVNAALQQYATGTDIGSLSFPHGLVLDPRVFTPIAALAPATAEDGRAAAMQHMGIIRDFMLTGGR